MRRGTKAIVAALVANLGIAVTKFVACVLTGSSSMLAEAIHSVADSGNQALLLLGGKRAQREATPKHPFGYGRERYIYAFIVSIVLFSVGGLFALYEAYHKLADPHAHRQLAVGAGGGAGRRDRPGVATRSGPRSGSPTTSAATPSWVDVRAPGQGAGAAGRAARGRWARCVGLVFALFGVVLTLITGDGIWDGDRHRAIGVLLVAIAVDPGDRDQEPAARRGRHPRGRREDRAGAAGRRRRRADHPHEDPAPGPRGAAGGREDRGARRRDRGEEVARAINEAEGRIRAAVPIARVIYLEPDIYRAAQAAAARPASARSRPRRTLHGAPVTRTPVAARTPGARARRSPSCRAGRRRRGEPEAELWLGAHPGDPSRARPGRPGQPGDADRRRPEGQLGADGGRRVRRRGCRS